MRKLLLLLLSLAVMFMFIGVSFAADATTVHGYVSDSKCGAKGKTNAECTKKCLQSGAKMVVVTDKTDKRCVGTGAEQRCKTAIQTNNVEVDDRGYVYIVDRANTGLHILELTGPARQIASFP